MYGLTLFSVFLASTHGTRIVVDDANSSWAYTGTGPTGWNAITPATPCMGCATQPDPSQAFNHTWHDTVYLNSAQLAFSGVSIEVYTICPGTQSNCGTNFTFTLDSVADGTFRGPQPWCTDFVYNYLVYARTNLTMGLHVFEITNSLDPDIDHSNTELLLDYAIYDDGIVVPPSASSASSTPSTPPASNSHSSLPITAIAIVAGLLLLANITQFVWYRKYKSGIPPYPRMPQTPFNTAA